MSKVEWTAGPNLAEYAEALGVPTWQIAAASEVNGKALVLYTPNLNKDATGDSSVFAVLFVRDADAILRELKRTPVGDMHEWMNDALREGGDLRKQIEARLESQGFEKKED